MAASSSANGGPVKKNEGYSASKSAMAAIFGPDHRYSKANTNETTAESGGTAIASEEPPSGIKGEGTISEPYDQGNAPEQIATDERGANGATSGAEPVSGVKGEGTADQPYDQGNPGETTVGSQPINTPTATAASTSPSTTVTATTATNGSTATSAAKEQPQEQQQEGRGRTLAPPASSDRFERSVSPGTLEDGSHEQCSGERGQGYTPSSGLGRLKNKFRSGT